MKPPNKLDLNVNRANVEEFKRRLEVTDAELSSEIKRTIGHLVDLFNEGDRRGITVNFNIDKPQNAVFFSAVRLDITKIQKL
jgi:hypothetical protein